MLKAALFHRGDGDRLLVVIHHLVVDGVSWRILLEDLSGLYEQLLSGGEGRLPLKSDSFRDWALRQQAYAKGRRCWRRGRTGHRYWRRPGRGWGRGQMGERKGGAGSWRGWL